MKEYRFIAKLVCRQCDYNYRVVRNIHQSIVLEMADNKHDNYLHLFRGVVYAIQQQRTEHKAATNHYAEVYIDVDALPQNDDKDTGRDSKEGETIHTQ